MRPILVTGAAKGLGSAICRTLASQGHDLVIHYRKSQKEAEALAKACSHFKVEVGLLEGDFSSQEMLETFISHYLDRFPHTKGIVNNVGNYLIAPATTTEPLQWLDLFQTNFFAPIFITQALLPGLKAAQGSVVNIGVTGLLAHQGFTESTAFAATKASLYFYTRSLAKELAADAVRVNMVSPGYMENAIDLDETTELPLKRPARLDEVAAVVASFFTPDSSYITGQNIEVAGGIGL